MLKRNKFKANKVLAMTKSKTLSKTISKFSAQPCRIHNVCILSKSARHVKKQEIVIHNQEKSKTIEIGP